MGIVLGTATGGGAEKGHNLKLVLSVLRVVRSLSKKLADRTGKTDKRDKRYGYLGNIQTSAGILTAQLEQIEEGGDTESFETQINELADCLEGIFSDQVIKLSKLKVSNARFRWLTNAVNRYAGAQAPPTPCSPGDRLDIGRLGAQYERLV